MSRNLADSIPKIQESLTQIVDSLNKLHQTDSVQQAIADSTFNASLLPKGHIGVELPLSLYSNSVVTIILVLLFILFGYIISFGEKTILETTKDFFYVKERSSIFNESSVNSLQFKGSLILIFIGSLGIYLFSLNSYLSKDLSNPDLYKYLGIFVVFACVFLLIKFIIFKFLGYVFLDRNTLSVFIRGYYTVIFGMGLAFFPLVVGLVYAPSRFQLFFLIIGLIILFAAFILVLYKIIQIFLINFYSFFYILLYLCALEILPVLLGLKVLS